MMDKIKKNVKLIGQEEGKDRQEGYTLIEVIITMFILGMIILVVNIIFIALVRVSYRVDIQTKVRQGVEFALEMIRRSTKSSKTDEILIVPNPSSECDDDGDIPLWCTETFNQALQMKIAETSYYVTYYVDFDEDSGAFVMKAMWQETLDGSEDIVRITSDADINIKSFDIVISPISDTGGTEILINLIASSVQMKTENEPVVSDVLKQEVIITRHGQL